ncbi:MAG: permease [Proteobacteria bacterium]|nr:MAG: permease [Pseudomonadota bacterium]
MAYLNIGSGQLVADASASERTAFYKRTYLHLGGAILAFVILESLLVYSGVAQASFELLRSVGSWAWLVVLLAFMGVAYLAESWAQSSISKEKQYAGLGLYVVAEAIIFMPIIYMALNFAPDAKVLSSAALLTLMLAGGITATAFITKKDFSFLGPILVVGSFIALGLIVASILFGFNLGLIFFAAMIIFAGAVMLYQTSQIIHQYHTEQYVAASLGLFASVALMFWYIVQFLMALAGGE